MTDIDVVEHNRRAWDRTSSSGGDRWCQPVDDAAIEAARRGPVEVILTPNRPVPQTWLGDLRQCRVLCLASGGGQQAPLLAAAGAHVVSFDASEEQLAKDAEVARRHDLDLTTARGDMADLGRFGAASFDLVFHPVSNVFVADPLPVWRHCRRVLRPGGRLLAGFMNPDFFLFDHDAIEAGGPLQVRFELPYSDLGRLDAPRLRRRVEAGQPLEFGHSLDVQIGGQIAAGFVLAGFYEDRWDAAATPLDNYMPTSMATLAVAVDAPQEPSALHGRAAFAQGT